MAVRQIFRYNSEDATFLNFSDWIAGLTDIERSEIMLSEAGLLKIERALVESGKLIVEFVAEGKIYTWTDDADAEVGIPEPLIWQNYHERYLEENNITLEIITETV